VSTTGLDPDRRARLLGLKLAALVRDGFRVEGAAPQPFAGGGASLQDGSRGWVLAEDDPHRALGPAMAWARANDVDDLAVLVEDGAGHLARRADAFTRPSAVWAVEGRAVARAAAKPHAPLVAPPGNAGAAVDLLQRAEVDVVVEHGEVLGEILGLEIARVVDDDEHGPRLEVGVGKHDREAFALLHGALPPEDAVAKVVDAVREQRRAAAAPHPLNRLAGERWLRSVVVAAPDLVGADALLPTPPVHPRTSVKDLAPAPAVGTDAEGRPVVVVASVGIDLDLVPAAADVRLRDSDPDARLVLVVPERDAHPVTQALAESLVHPAEVVGVPGDWRSLASTDHG